MVFKLRQPVALSLPNVSWSEPAMRLTTLLNCVFVWMLILLVFVIYFPHLSLSTFSKGSETLIVMPGDCKGHGAMVITTGGKKKKSKCKKEKKSETVIILTPKKKKKRKKKKKSSMYFDENYGFTPSTKKCKMVCF